MHFPNGHLILRPSFSCLPLPLQDKTATSIGGLSGNLYFHFFRMLGDLSRALLLSTAIASLAGPSLDTSVSPWPFLWMAHAVI
jgi:hypothetical protein